MKLRSKLGVLFCLVLLSPSFAVVALWGFPTHRMIAAKAVDFLPESPFKKFALEHKDYIRDQSVYPDEKREAFPDEGPNHYVDLEMYGVYTSNDPRLETGFDEPKGLKDGKLESHVKGRLPWRIEEVYDRLVIEMKTHAWVQAKLSMAELAHYLSDMTMPFHTTENYDGQLTGQKGIHGRIEMDLTDNRIDSLFLGMSLPAEVKAMDAAGRKALVWKVIKTGFQAVPDMLKSDKESMAVSESRDKQLDYFWEKQNELIQKRMVKAVWVTACFWQSAWEDAGKPDPLIQVEDEPAAAERVKGVISAEQSKQHIGKEATVEFTVVKVGFSESSKRYFLNSHDPYKGHFTAVIMPEAQESLEKSLGGGIREKLEKQKLRVTGKIRDKNGSPEILVRNAEQLSIGT